MRVSAPLPVVAIVGRPNVGKSTFFNRILGERQAVVHPMPGVTRDRNYGEAEHRRQHFFLVDTGGFEPESQERMFVQMREQTLLAVDEADAIIFLADVTETDNPADDEIIQILRRCQKPIFLVVNKCDSLRRQDEAYALSRFGFDRVYPVSALHGRGILDLLDDLLDALPDAPRSDREGPMATRIAIVGRQNAGKSTLLNRLLGQERVISNPTPGTTRDAIDTYLDHEGKLYCLIDTAGIRRRGRIERGIEHLSVMSAVLAIQRCDVAVLVIDAERGIHAQDTHIAGTIAEHWKPCIIALNKWDAIEKDDKTYNEFVKKTREEFKFLPHAKIEAVSALSGQRCHKLWSLVDLCVEQSSREIPTADLNRVLQAAMYKVTPPAFGGRTLKVKYATQVASNPPTFVLFVNDPRLVHFSYQRYLLNRLRAAFGFEGTPIRVIYRRKSPPEGWEQYVKERDRLRQHRAARKKEAQRKKVQAEQGGWELSEEELKARLAAKDDDESTAGELDEMETVWVGRAKADESDDGAWEEDGEDTLDGEDSEEAEFIEGEWDDVELEEEDVDEDESGVGGLEEAKAGVKQAGVKSREDRREVKAGPAKGSAPTSKPGKGQEAKSKAAAKPGPKSRPAAKPRPKSKPAKGPKSRPTSRPGPKSNPASRTGGARKRGGRGPSPGPDKRKR